MKVQYRFRRAALAAVGLVAWGAAAHADEAAAHYNMGLQLKRQGLGALIVSHDHGAVRALADRVIEVTEGKAVTRGG